MKKLLVFTLCLCLVLSLCACGNSQQQLRWKTIGEILEDENVEYYSQNYDEKLYVCAFVLDGVPYRVIAASSPETMEAYNNLDFMADDYEEQFNALFGELKVLQVDDMSSEIMKQEELDALIGKTGGELLADGFSLDGSGYSDDFIEATFEKGNGIYYFNFEGEINEDLFGEPGFFENLTVTSVSFQHLSYAVLDLYALEGIAGLLP